MQRRSFLTSSAALGAASLEAQGQPKRPVILELRYFRMRNSQEGQRQKLGNWLGKVCAPALKRIGVDPVGLFSSSIGEDTPYALAVISHPDLESFRTLEARLVADSEFAAASEPLFGKGSLLFQRMEVQLLEAFPGFPKVEVPPAGERPRLFELRTYESNDAVTLERKIGMFEGGEIDIFRKYGLLPVFFGKTIAGRKMPNLTYMVAFDDLAARAKNWSAFATSPEWKKLAGTPGLSDAEIVSNISNALLTPLAGSAIR
jgi:hypothetical protein